MKKLFASLKTLRVRLLAIVALCWLLPTLVLGVYMSGIFFDALKEKTEQALISGASHAQEMTVQELDRIIKKSKDVTYDGLLSDYAARYEDGSMRYEDFYANSRIYWQRMFQRERAMAFTAFFLLEDPAMIIHTASSVSDLLSFQEKVQPEVITLGEKLDTQSRFVYLDDTLYHVRNLFNRKMERFGMIALSLDESQVLQPLLSEDTLWEGQVDIRLDDYVLLADAEKAYTPRATAKGLFEQDGDLYYEQRVPVADYTLSYRIRLDKSIMFGQLDEYYQLIAALLMLLLPLEALIMIFIHASLTQPLVRLAKATERLAVGELGITVPTTGADEIGRLGTAFNAMSLQMQTLIDKSYKEELALRDARISSLQSRINPHFLNNALELMNWEARIEGADSVSQMIEALSTLINATLDRTNQRTVPLSEELEVADAYFFFIQQRFGDRLCIEKEIDPALLTVHVPRLIIQTLLENAVEHGIDPVGGGVIRLHAYVCQQRLRIDVRNDGKLLDCEEQKKINDLLSPQVRQAPSLHMGIRNVNLRLKLIYHEEAGLSLLRDERGETLARIEIPYKYVMPKEEEDD